MTILASTGDSVPLALVLEDGSDSLYPRAYVYSEGGTLIGTTDLAYVSGGLYLANYTMPGIPMKYLVVFVTFVDAGRTEESLSYGRAETIVDTESLGVLTGTDHPIIASGQNPERV